MTAAQTPEPPYYAVIFSAQLANGVAGYGEAAARMEQLAATMPGYIGIESARDEAGFGITVSYWESEEAIKNWKRNAEHIEAQRRGVETWYSNYIVRIARVERAYVMKNKETHEEKTG